MAIRYLAIAAFVYILPYGDFAGSTSVAWGGHHQRRWRLRHCATTPCTSLPKVYGAYAPAAAWTESPARQDLPPELATSASTILAGEDFLHLVGVNARLLFSAIQTALKKAKWEVDDQYGPIEEIRLGDRGDVDIVWVRTRWHRLPRPQYEIRHYVRGVALEGAKRFEIKVFSQARLHGSLQYFSVEEETSQQLLDAIAEYLK
ncbi:MAG TPA: hypothetical protein VFW87_13260 [Pirellulales bacterium]|nr:hypothetical protein [Pirellulales bacterium]